MPTYIDCQAKLEGGPYDGGIDSIDYSQCKKGGEYTKLYQKVPRIIIVYEWASWINQEQKKSLFRFKEYRKDF